MPPVQPGQWGPAMLASLAPAVRPLAVSVSGNGTTTDSTAPVSAPAASAIPGGTVAVPAGSAGSGSPGSGGNHPSGAYVAAAYAEHGTADDASALPGDPADAGPAQEGRRWMSAEVTQPNAPSFAESTRRLQQADADAAVAAQRRASLDYLVSSMKTA